MEKIINYETSYTTPNGLSENDYCRLMNQLMEFVQSKRTYRKASPEIIYWLCWYGIGYTS